MELVGETTEGWGVVREEEEQPIIQLAFLHALDGQITVRLSPGCQDVPLVEVNIHFIA